MPKIIDPQEKRREFIEASLEVISNQGMAEATLRKVAAQLDCTTGSLTHYFSNREALLVATMRHVHLQAAERMARAIDQQTDDLEKLRVLLLEALPLDHVRLKEWRTWLAFWTEAMRNERLSEENVRRYEEWENALYLVLQPIITDAEQRRAEVYALRVLIDGFGLAITMRGVTPRRLAKERKLAHTAVNSRLHQIGEN